MSDLSIANTAIRNQNDLYNLNDLHKASGNKVAHKPANWLKLKQTQELITELTDDGIPSSKQNQYLTEELTKPQIRGLKQNQQVIEVIKGGHNQGTFVCKELVYAYATWISPRFFLQVLRTFDAVMTAQPHMTVDELRHWQWTTQHYAEKIGHDQAEMLHFLMRRWIEQSGLQQQTAYHNFHTHMGVGRTDYIKRQDFKKAMTYLHLKTGQINHGATDFPAASKRQPAPALPDLQAACLTEREQQALSALIHHFKELNVLVYNLQRPLSQIGYPHSADLFDHRQIANTQCMMLKRFA